MKHSETGESYHIHSFKMNSCPCLFSIDNATGNGNRVFLYFFFRTREGRVVSRGCDRVYSRVQQTEWCGGRVWEKKDRKKEEKEEVTLFSHLSFSFSPKPYTTTMTTSWTGKITNTTTHDERDRLHHDDIRCHHEWVPLSDGMCVVFSGWSFWRGSIWQERLSLGSSWWYCVSKKI